MKLLCVGYRSWAHNIYCLLAQRPQHSVVQLFGEDLSDEVIEYSAKALQPDVILFYGWSRIVPAYITDTFHCLMLHPSDLPSFRGGSPLQNQIIRGIKHTKISIFRMSSRLDDGQILAKCDFSLDGEIPDIFERLTTIGFSLTEKLLRRDLVPDDRINEGEVVASYYPRLQPRDSEITLCELKTQPAEYLFNKIRMLTGEYPRAHIKCGDGRKLYLDRAHLDE